MRRARSGCAASRWPASTSGKSVLTDDGWFPTRDAGWFDEEGYLYVDGRLDDVIVRGAENISPGEIEEVLMAHPAVAEAAVIGIPDTEWGEAVASVVVLHPGEEATEPELQAWVKERLRSTKMPCVVEFRDELPYSPTGQAAAAGAARRAVRVQPRRRGRRHDEARRTTRRPANEVAEAGTTGPRETLVPGRWWVRSAARCLAQDSVRNVTGNDLLRRPPER